MREIIFLHSLFLSSPVPRSVSPHPLFSDHSPQRISLMAPAPPRRYLSPPFADLGQSPELSLSLSLSVLLTLPALRPVLHNGDDSIGTGCICSTVSGYIWPQLTGVNTVFCFKPQPTKVVQPLNTTTNKRTRHHELLCRTRCPAQRKGGFTFFALPVSTSTFITRDGPAALWPAVSQ